MKRTAWLLSVTCMLLTACAPGDSDVCTEAANHLTQCTGTAPAPSSCDTQLARQVLGTPCADLMSPGGKSDGLSNPTSMAICISLGIPLLITDSPEGGLCCFSYNCEGDLTCRKHICRQPSEFGGPCDRRGHCVDGLVCRAGGTCGDPVEDGGACEPGECASGLVCGPNGTCGPRGADNATCDQDYQCEDVCIGGACAPRSGDGGPCDPGDSFDCNLGLKCVEGSCQKPPASGGACDREDPFVCPMGETCWNGTCEPRHGEGDPCERMFDCEHGLFCKDDVCGPL